MSAPLKIADLKGRVRIEWDAGEVEIIVTNADGTSASVTVTPHCAFGLAMGLVLAQGRAKGERP